MSYHIEDARGSFNELPERILMREDGYLGAYKSHGKPIVDYWYVPMERVERLESENAKLREQMERLVTLLRVDCDIEASWDGLRHFWSIELTEDGCLMRDRACKAEAENAKLRKLVKEALMANKGGTFWEYFDPYSFWAGWCKDAHELGIEVPE